MPTYEWINPVEQVGGAATNNKKKMADTNDVKQLNTPRLSASMPLIDNPVTGGSGELNIERGQLFPLGDGGF